MITPAEITVRHLSTFPHGGAAMAAQRLHVGLKRYGVNSQFLYHHNDGTETPAEQEDFQQLTFDKKAHLHAEDGKKLDWLSFRVARFKEKKIHQLFHRHLANRPEGFETYAMARLHYPTPFPQVDDWQQHDVVHLHWISFFLDYPSFFQSIPDHVPIVWTLHDTNAFTGGCHFVSGCEGFQSGCGSCPQIQHPKPNDVSHHSFTAKQLALQNKNVHVVSPSDWLTELAKKSSVWPEHTQFQKIHYGLDLKKFQPIDRNTARQSLGLPKNAKLIAFGAADVTNKRKGVQYLAEALRIVQQQSPQKVECLIFGAGDLEFDSDVSTVHSMGFVEEAARLNQIYSAADMLVIPSLEDNQPQTGLEAMACGTPVVAFEAGGIPEFVRHEQTGLLARLADSNDLAKQMIRLVNDSNLQQRMGKSARAMMEMEFETETQAWHHLKFYRDILQPTSVAAPASVSASQPQRKRAA